MHRISVLVSILLIAGCSTTPAPQGRTQPAPAPAAAPIAAPTKPLFGEHGFDMTGMDRTVHACDNFYQFAVGNWRKMNPLPAAYSRYGRFEQVADRNRETLHAILDESAKNPNPPGSAAQKIGDFYGACMNEAAIETAGDAPIAPELARIDAINDRTALQSEVFHLQSAGISPVFRFGGQNDQKNSKMVIAVVAQAGLGLPDRDYYLRDDERFQTTRKQYVDHIAKMLQLIGEEPARASTDADRVMALETQLARAQMSRIEMRTPEKTYNITPVAQLASIAPNVNWPALLQSAGLTDLQTLNVAQPEFFKTVSRLVDEVPLETWKAYLKWHVLDQSATSLSSAFVNEDFNFSGRILSGTKEQQERWKRCVRSTDFYLGDLLGQEYVRRTFTPEAKAKMNALIDNLVSALREDIPTLAWMGPETKAAALDKLNAFTRRIGYPDKWIDYSKLAITRDSYAKDVMAAREFAHERNVGRIGKPDDPNEWGRFTPPTVNASYNPTRNDITFPAGILQPPFYDPNADDAYNYGGIGTVIGHEMTHGFDDQGAKFDPQGNLRNWWTAEDLKNFQARTECIVNEYNDFQVEPGMNTQGKLVTGEAIADLGGATIALRAYEKSLEGKQRATIDGFTPEQRFFLGFAQVWGENMAPEEARRRALTDPHAQGPFRVNGTVQNMPEFQRAFHCSEGAPMVRAEAKRCSIW
ncbi:MAG TPA: M13 family metallopeptidase [Thermoanaerobaculia bacterium]|nr:M13 family metallopeptidase [Thermoanaerobaculia bacterium]